MRSRCAAGAGVVTDATFDAEGCGATIAAASACVALARRSRPLLEAAAHRPRRRRRRARRAFAGQAARRRSRRGRASPRAVEGRGARPGRPLEPRARPRAGRDERRRRQRRGRAARSARRARGRRRDAQAVGRPGASTAREAAARPQAVLGARALAHSMGLPHLTLDLQDGSGDAVVERLPRRARRAAARRTRACAATGMVRFDAMLALADRVGAEALVTGHYARIERDARGPAARARRRRRARTRPTCSPALRPAAARARPLPARRADQAARCERSRARRACRSRTSARARTSASSPAPTASASSPATAASSERPGEIVDRARPRARPPPRPPPLHGRPAHAGSASRRASRSTCSRPTRAPNTVVVGPRARARGAARASSAPATLYRDGARVDRVKLRYRSKPVAVPGRRPRARQHERLELELDERRSTASPPGQTACLHGRRPRGRPRHDRAAAAPRVAAPRLGPCPRAPRQEIREAFLSFFEAARPPARAVGVARARRRTTRRCCSRPPACSRSSPTSSARSRRRTRASPRARSASARPTSTRSA